MGIDSFQNHIEQECPQACRPVDLLDIARGFARKRRGRGGRLRLVVDAESCLDRLYGGFYSDWACGGQWNRMVNFLNILIGACIQNNVELVVFFNGALESQRLDEWYQNQADGKKKVAQVFKHVNNKATPPPKIWWIPPVYLQACLRMALRQFSIPVACSMDDHHQEVIAYCRENNFNGLIAHDSDYAIFDPPHYFSSQHLKLTYKGVLETKEYIMDEVAKSLDLHPKRFCVFAALLGNHILPETDLMEFFETISKKSKEPKDLIPEVAAYVRSLASVDDLDELGKDVFKHSGSGMAEKVSSFKQSVQYYLNGTQEGFLKYRPKIQASSTPTKQPGSYPGKPQRGSKDETAKQAAVSEEERKKMEERQSSEEKEKDEPTDEKGEEADDEEEKEEEKEFKPDKVYTEGESGYAQESSQMLAPEIVIDPPSSAAGAEVDLEAVLGTEVSKQFESKVGEKKDEGGAEKKEEKPGTPTVTFEKPEEGDSTAETDGEIAEASSSSPNRLELAKLSSSSSSSSSGSSPNRLSPDTAWTMKIKASPQVLSQKKLNGEKSIRVPPEIMRVASERHQKGLMTPWIYMALSQGEIKIDVTMEDDNNRDLPSAVELYRLIRQHVYAILFDLGKKKAANKTSQNNGAEKEIVIKEWIVPRGNGSSPRHELVKAEPLEWRVPSIRRLWLGQEIIEKNRRIRAFLSCMLSDMPLMLNTSYVPQQFLIMCCVLRFIIQYKDRDKRVLRKHELDAFLAAAVSPLLDDVDTMQEMKLPMITTRGVQLAALFMRGVEAAIFANDACGAPIPWVMCCPWQFFDGKLFHFKLLKANNNTALLDICDGQVSQVMRVERMRQAVMEGLKPDQVFAKPALPLMPQQYTPGGLYPAPLLGFRPAGAPVPPPMAPPGSIGRGRGLLGRSPVDTRGGQLEIAGVVVGNWGPNTQGQRPIGRGTHIVPPHITSVGPRRGRGIMATRARGRAGYPRGLTGRPLPRTQIPAQHFYSSGPGRMYRGRAMRPRGRGGSGPLTFEQQTKVSSSGRGRGCTFENPADGASVISVSQLMSREIELQKASNGLDSHDHNCHEDEEGLTSYSDEEEDGKYADAENDLGVINLNHSDEHETGKLGKTNLLSPDSGIVMDANTSLTAVE